MRIRLLPGGDEAGVVAIIVALSISTFLLGSAALAVDLGTAYVRKAELKALAEKVAIAGATALPDITGGLSEAVDTLGSGGTPGTGLCADLDLPGVCTATGNWASDNNPANGEITFYADDGQTGELADRNGDGQLSTADRVSGGEAIGINVLLPKSQVPFGLASTLGFNSASLQESASARLGTPLGSGILPFGLSPTDLANGQFCVSDPTLPPAPVNPYPGSLSLYSLTATPGTVDSNNPSPVVKLTISPPFGVPNTIRVYFENKTNFVTAVRSGGGWTVTAPDGDPGTSVRIWARWTGFFGATITQPATIVYSGTAPSGTSPCTLPQVNHGYARLARTSPSGDTLEPNIRLSTQVKLYPSGGLLGSLGQGLDCVSAAFSSASTCLKTVFGESFSTRLTDGFFDSSSGTPGRLVGDCGGGTYSPRGFGGVDAMRLLDAASPLVDDSFGTVSSLQSSILSGTLPNNKEGWIRSQAFRCPRLAVMPVLDPTPLPGVVSGQSITKLTYVWIDDDGSGRGFSWAGSRLRSFRGYVLDPKYFGSVVAGSPIVGPYLGPDMPKEALLIPNLPTP